jgi:hypothetical protein
LASLLLHQIRAPGRRNLPGNDGQYSTADFAARMLPPIFCAGSILRRVVLLMAIQVLLILLRILQQ